MIETLILGILIGALATCIGASYSAYKFLKKPYVLKELSDGYSAVIIDKTFDNDDPNNYIAIKKGDDIIAAIKFNEKGITDICYDI